MIDCIMVNQTDRLDRAIRGGRLMMLTAAIFSVVILAVIMCKEISQCT